MSSVKEFYNNHSFKYEQFEAQALTNKEKYPLLFQIRTKERQLLEKGFNKKVFYFATGSGSDIVHLNKSGAKIVTLDFSIEMINRTIDRMKKEGVAYKLLKNQNHLTEEFINNFFEQNPNDVLVIFADIKQLKLPKNYFDYCFCYCTLPLLEDAWQEVLLKMLFSSKNGAVSVYLKERISHLKDYYIDFGFNSNIAGRTICLEGGFVYYCIPPEKIIEVIEKEKSLEIIDSGLGKIYFWSL
ncbi:class I SAM-dependent methyltransferase [Candidatus Micrarchaeota archaeon]|nr:class I SAM-dependent methyltransferase [Candidatus Micrarchaeota archaeon]MBU2477428.1 class I SAM-dependent methyltransferase [Candidatus Micrarchaeota archaeon]